MILTVADARRILQASDYGKGHKKQKVRKQANTETLELAYPHAIETLGNIISEIRKDKKPYALKVAKELEKSSFGDRVLMDDAANCLRDDCTYIKEIADRVEAAKEREQYEICHIISKLVMDSELLRDSDERNRKPYKLFGEPLTVAYGRFACQLYRAANIQRKFWLAYLKETHSDPEWTNKVGGKNRPVRFGVDVRRDEIYAESDVGKHALGFLKNICLSVFGFIPQDGCFSEEHYQSEDTYRYTANISVILEQAKIHSELFQYAFVGEVKGRAL